MVWSQWFLKNTLAPTTLGQFTLGNVSFPLARSCFCWACPITLQQKQLFVKGKGSFCGCLLITRAGSWLIYYCIQSYATQKSAPLHSVRLTLREVPIGFQLVNQHLWQSQTFYNRCHSSLFGSVIQTLSYVKHINISLFYQKKVHEVYITKYDYYILYTAFFGWKAVHKAVSIDGQNKQKIPCSKRAQSKNKAVETPANSYRKRCFSMVIRENALCTETQLKRKAHEQRICVEMIDVCGGGICTSASHNSSFC